MIFPRQLAPTVGLSHDGFEFLKGSSEGLVVGWMTKNRRGKLYIDDEGWGPEAGSIEYGYQVQLAEFMSSSARSANRALSRTSPPTSSKWLSVQVLPRLSLP